MESRKLREIKEQLEGNSSEFLHDIGRHLPNRISKLVIIYLVLILGAVFLFGYLIRYPQVVTGQISLVGDNKPVKLVANASGKVHLNGFGSQDKVEEGAYIAWVESAVNPAHIRMLKEMLPPDIIHREFPLRGAPAFPDTLSLGDITVRYYNFAGSYRKVRKFYQNNVYAEQERSMEKLLRRQVELVNHDESQIYLKQKLLTIATDELKRDSALFSQHVLSKAMFNESERRYLNNMDNYQQSLRNIIVNQQQLTNTTNNLALAGIQKKEEEERLWADLTSHYNELISAILAYEERYVFKAPFQGRIEFLRFLTNEQFLQMGDEVISIVPDNKTVTGQMLLPADGAGKVVAGQKVNVKVDDFPFQEFGMLTGTVKSISLITNEQKQMEGARHYYLAWIEIDNELLTTYGKQLPYKPDLKGTGEIVTRDLRLIQRLFDNTRYLFN